MAQQVRFQACYLLISELNHLSINAFLGQAEKGNPHGHFAVNRLGSKRTVEVCFCHPNTLHARGLPCDSNPTQSVHASLDLLTHKLINKLPGIWSELGLLTAERYGLV
jgi:hypothetical protein